MYLLTRDNFRETVFTRDRHQCIVCGRPAEDAHHIMERRLFDDGGYYVENGVSLCGTHHLEAEMTLLSCENLRDKAGIEIVVLPPHLYTDNKYDKWGNIFLPSGQRIKGELFFDESVQKILRAGGILDCFIKHIKYPRTYHLPWTQNVGKDDKVLDSIAHLTGRAVVITEKMDGENTTLYSDYIHARSIDGNSHPSQSWIRNFHAGMRHDIPDGWRICGENLYAKHSIGYGGLPSFFMVFSIWNEANECLSWKATKEWCGLIGLHTVPVLFEGLFTPNVTEEIKANKRYVPADFSLSEGYVLRLERSFPYGAFRQSVAKFVRKNHVATTVHNWRHDWHDCPEMKNGLKEEEHESK